MSYEIEAYKIRLYDGFALNINLKRTIFRDHNRSKTACYLKMVQNSPSQSTFLLHRHYTCNDRKI